MERSGAFFVAHVFWDCRSMLEIKLVGMSLTSNWPEGKKAGMLMTPSAGVF